MCVNYFTLAAIHSWRLSSLAGLFSRRSYG